MDNNVINLEIGTDKKERNRDKHEPIWKFSENKIEFTFENLISLIRMFFLFCIFYVFVWISRDKNANIQTTSQLFSFYNSFFCSVLSIYYFFTGSVRSVLLIAACFFSSTLADMYYGYNHYHSIMCKPNGYIHHVIYLIIWIQYLIWFDMMSATAMFSLCEIATFFLNIKYVFQINSFLLQIIILLSFIVFRVLYWVFLMYKNTDTFIKNKFSGIISIIALFLHIQWTVTHAYKTWNYTKR